MVIAEFSDDLDDEPVHPALRHFNSNAVKVAHVVGTVLKFAAVGAIVGGLFLGGAAVLTGVSLGTAALSSGGAVLAALPALAIAGPCGAIVAAIGGIGTAILGAVGLWNLGTLGGMVLSGLALATGAGVAVGVVAGAALGLLFGCSGMNEVAEAKADETIEQWERSKERHHNRELMAQQLRKQRLELSRQEQALGIYSGLLPASPHRHHTR